MLKNINAFLKDEEGATAIEYGLIAGLLAAVIAGVLLTTGQSLNGIFLAIQNALATGGGGG